MHNYDDTYYGSSSLESCTIHSDNSCFAELALGRSIRCVQGCGGSPAVRGGTKAIAQLGHRMGLKTKFSTNPSMVLGAIDPGVTPLEMAYAYATIANGGERVGGNLDATPGPNDHLRRAGAGGDRQGRATRRATRSPRTSTKEIARPLLRRGQTRSRTSFTRTSSRGTGKLAQFGDDAEWGKTGTTENNGDAWFCGGTQPLHHLRLGGSRATAPTPMETDYNGGPVDGGTFPALIWGRVMYAIESIYRTHKAEAKDSGDSSSSSTDSSSASYSHAAPLRPASSAQRRRQPGDPAAAAAAVATPGAAPPRGGGGGGGGGATGGTGGTGL